MRWAMAGRSKEKLEQVRKEVAMMDQSAANVELLTADLENQASLDSIAAASKVGFFLTLQRGL